jgi:hypothetical protein
MTPPSLLTLRRDSRTSPAYLYILPNQDPVCSSPRPRRPVTSLLYPNPAHTGPLLPSRQQTNPLQSLTHVLSSRRPDNPILVCSAHLTPT